MKHTIALVCCCITFFALSTITLSSTMTFSGSGEYVLGDNDTITEAKNFALQDAKRVVLEKMGTYIQSQTEVKNYQVTKDEIITYSQGSIKIKQLDEERFQVGEKSLGIRINIIAEANSDEIFAKLDSISGQESLKKDIAEMKKEYDLLKKQIAQINKSLMKEKDEEKISSLREERKEILQKIENREEGISVLTSGQGLFNEALVQKKRFEEDKTTVKRFFHELIGAYKIEAGKPKINYESNDKATIIIEGKITLPVKYGEYSQKNTLPFPSFESISDLGISFHGPFIRSQPNHKYFDCSAKRDDNRSNLATKYLRKKLSKLLIEARAGKHQAKDLLPVVRETHALEGLYIERDFRLVFHNLPLNDLTKINKIDIKVICNELCQKV